MPQPTISEGKRNHFIGTKVVVLTCLLVATLDISAALIDSHLRYGITPLELFQYIASGILGKAAFSGGTWTALVGLLLHYFIASSWTVLFFKLYPKLKIPPAYKIISGILFGILIWCFMNLIVVPLSRAHRPLFNWNHIIIGALYIIFLIALPISLIYHKYYPADLNTDQK